MCFHICLEEKKNETVGLFPTSLAQEITRYNPRDETHFDVVRGLILPRGFHPAHQQVELVRAMQLLSTRTNRSAYCLCQGLDSKLKNLD